MKKTAWFLILVMAISILVSCSVPEESDVSENSISESEISENSTPESENSTPESEISENSDDNSTESEVSENSEPSEEIDWAGEYEYGIEVFNDNGEFEFGIGYGITIYKENGKYQGRVEAGGRGIDQDFSVDFTEENNKIDAYFIESNPDKLPPPPYEKGDLLFSLVEKDEKLYTIFHAYSVEGLDYEKGERTIAFIKQNSK